MGNKVKDWWCISRLVFVLVVFGLSEFFALAITPASLSSSSSLSSTSTTTSTSTSTSTPLVVECKDAYECENEILICEHNKICELICSGDFSCRNVKFRIAGDIVEQVIVRLNGQSSGEDMTIDSVSSSSSSSDRNEAEEDDHDNNEKNQKGQHSKSSLLSHVRKIQIFSSNLKAAKGVFVYGQKHDHIEMKCLGEQSCEDSAIYAIQSESLTVDCTHDGACHHAAVYCPLVSNIENHCNIQCHVTPHHPSCQDIEIWTADSSQVKIDCENTEACTDVSMHCDENFGTTCKYEYDILKGWHCESCDTNIVEFSIDDVQTMGKPDRQTRRLMDQSFNTVYCNNNTECRCIGDYSCYKSRLICQSPTCKVICSGISACEATEVDATDYTITMVEIILSGMRSGAAMAILGYNVEFPDTSNQNSYYRITNQIDLWISVNVQDYQGFMGSRIYAAHRSNVEVYCNNTYACAFSRILSSNADSVALHCSVPDFDLDSASYTCFDSMVYCPVDATLLNQPGKCVVDCGSDSLNCREMKIFNIGGKNSMDLICDTASDSCSNLRFRCGMGLQYSCTAYIDGTTYSCPACESIPWDPYVANVTNGNYFIAEYLTKYDGKQIYCNQNQWGGDSCIVISGTNAYYEQSAGEARSATIYSDVRKSLWLFGHSKYSFRYAQVNTQYTPKTKAVYLYSYSKTNVFDSITVGAPQELLEMNCNTKSSCTNSVINTDFCNEYEVEVKVNCNAASACSYVSWNLQWARHADLICGSYEGSCQQAQLNAPEINYTRNDTDYYGQPPLDLTCYEGSLKKASCYEMSIYAVGGLNEANINCWAPDWDPRVDPEPLQSDFGCNRTSLYCSPHYEFSCQLQPDYQNTYGYYCDSICYDYSYQAYLENAPTVSPTGSPSFPPTRHPTTNPVLPPTLNPTLPPTKYPTGFPTQPPTANPTAAPILPPTSTPTRSPTGSCSTDGCTIDCSGDNRCVNSDLYCYAGYCILTCDGENACANAKLHTYFSNTYQMDVFIETTHAAPGLSIMTYDITDIDSNNWAARYIDSNPLDLNIVVNGDEGFNGTVYASHGVSINMKCRGTQSCRDAKVYATNAEKLDLTCTNDTPAPTANPAGPTTSTAAPVDQENCIDMTVYCPIYTDTSDPSQCKVDCGIHWYTCQRMSIFNNAGMNGMELSCDPSRWQCDDLILACGSIFNRTCMFEYTENGNYTCIDANDCSETYIYTPPNVAKTDWFIAEFEQKYADKDISCLGHSPQDCILVGGLDGTDGDFTFATINSGDVAALSLFTHGYTTFYKASIDASMAEKLVLHAAPPPVKRGLVESKRALVTVIPFSYEQYRYVHIEAPKQELIMYCDTDASCMNSSIFANQSETDNLAITIRCAGHYSCANSRWFLQSATTVNIECQDQDLSCGDVLLRSPVSMDDSPSVQMTCSTFSYLPSCSNLTIYATQGDKDVDLHCNLGSYACEDSTMYCSPQYEFSCLLEPSGSTRGYQCDSICSNYSVELYNEFAPTAFPTQTPTKPPTNKPTTPPTKMPTTPPTKKPTNRPSTAPTLKPTGKPTKPPTNKPTSSPTTPKPTTPNPTIAPTTPRPTAPPALDITVNIPLKNSDSTVNSNLRFQIIATMRLSGEDINYQTIASKDLTSTWVLFDHTDNTVYNLSTNYTVLSTSKEIAYARKSAHLGGQTTSRRNLLQTTYYEVVDTFVFNSKTGYTQSSQYTTDICNKGGGLLIPGHSYTLSVSSRVVFNNTAKSPQTLSASTSVPFVVNSPPYTNVEVPCSISPKNGSITTRFNLSCTDIWNDDSSTSRIVYFDFIMGSIFVAPYFAFDIVNRTAVQSSTAITYNDKTKLIHFTTTLSSGITKVTAVIKDSYGGATCVSIPVVVDTTEAFQGQSPSNFFNVTTPGSSLIGSLLFGSSSAPVNLNDDTQVQSYLQNQLYVNGTINQVKALEVISNLSQASSAYSTYSEQLVVVSNADVPVIVNFSYYLTEYAVYLIDTLQPQSLDEVAQALNVLSVATNGIGSICDNLNDVQLSEGGTAGSAASQSAADDHHLEVANHALEVTQTLITTVSSVLINGSGVSLDKTTAQNGLQSVSNILNNLACAGAQVESEDGGDTFLGSAQQIGQLASADLVTGEQVTVTSPVINVTLSRVTTDQDADSEELAEDSNKATQCSDEVLLPNTAFAAYQEYSDNVDCAVVSSHVNPYNPGNEQADNFTGIVVDVTVSVPLTTAAEYGEPIEVDSAQASNFADQCNPAIIKIQNKHWADYSDTTVSYPSCSFYNTKTGKWEDRGCYVWKRDEDNSVLCVCNHTTTFSVKGTTFTPKVNYVKLNSFRDINAKNLAKYPAGWILVLVVFTVFAVLLYMAPEVNDKPLIAHTRGVWRHFRDTNWYEFRIGLEAKILRSTESMTWKILKLWYIAIRCDHMVIGLFFRYKGTGYRRQARLSSFLAKMFTLTAANALFYGNPTDPWGNAWVISFYASLIQMPLVFVKFCFKRYQNIERSDKEEIDVQLKATENLLKVIELQDQEYMKATNSSAAVGEAEDAVSTNDTNPGALIVNNTDTVGVTTTPGEEQFYSLGSTDMLTEEQKKQISRWKPQEFETMDIETLTRILEASAEVNSPRGAKTTTTMATTTETQTETELLVSAEQKYLASSALRRKIMDQQYSWWHWCKYAAWIFTIVWTLVCAILTLIYVVRFDMLRDANNSYTESVQSKCAGSASVDVGDMAVTQYNETQRAMTDYLERVAPATLDQANGFIVKQSVDSWLLSIFIGFLLSLFVWQPLFDLILQIVRVIRFDPDEVNEMYFFGNSKLLLTQQERDALVRSGAQIGADDDADRESEDGNEDAHSEERKNVPDPVMVPYSGDTNEQNVLDELDRQMSIEMLRAQIELMETRTPEKKKKKKKTEKEKRNAIM